MNIDISRNQGGWTGFAMITAIVFGFLLGWTIRAELAPELPPELELRSLQDCIQDNQCHMDPPAYVRYYELKELIETDGDRQ